MQLLQLANSSESGMSTLLPAHGLENGGHSLEGRIRLRNLDAVLVEQIGVSDAPACQLRPIRVVGGYSSSEEFWKSLKQ